jgi:hypothetical protein
VASPSRSVTQKSSMRAARAALLVICRRAAENVAERKVDMCQPTSTASSAAAATVPATATARRLRVSSLWGTSQDDPGTYAFRSKASDVQ